MNPVYFYYANIIGYIRIFLLFYAGYLSLRSPIPAIISYIVSMGLDAIDGMVARYFKQTSKFGAQLDMLTDRMSTCCLYVVLASSNNNYWVLSCTMIMLDIVSHWLHMMSKMEAGNTSHKTARNWYLRQYYSYPYFMLTLCVGQ